MLLEANNSKAIELRLEMDPMLVSKRAFVKLEVKIQGRRLLRDKANESRLLLLRNELNVADREGFAVRGLIH